MLTVSEVSITVDIHTSAGHLQSIAVIDGLLFDASKLLPADQLTNLSRPQFEAIEKQLLQKRDET